MGQEINIGDLARDMVTKIEGVVVIRHDYLYGVSRVGIQPQGSFEGKAHETIHVDILQAELVQEKAVSRKGTIAKEERIALGSKAKCRITGFEGICTGRAEWLYACTKVMLQPQKLQEKTGQPIEPHWFDEGQVGLIDIPQKDIVESRERRTTGGFGQKNSDNMYKVSK